jgi:hypothetical protein
VTKQLDSHDEVPASQSEALHLVHTGEYLVALQSPATSATSRIPTLDRVAVITPQASGCGADEAAHQERYGSDDGEIGGSLSRLRR